MTLQKRLVAGCFVALLLLLAGRTAAQSFGDSALTAAAASYLDAPAPKVAATALERLLAEAGVGARTAFALECRRQMTQLVQDQEGLEPASDKYRRSLVRLERLQAAASAAQGDFRALRAVGDSPAFMETPTATRATASAPPANPEKENLGEQLRSFRARVESLRAKHEPIWRALTATVASAVHRLESVRYYERLIEEEISGISNRHRDLEALAEAATAAEREARVNALRAAEGARATVKELEFAQTLASACHTAEDASRLAASLNRSRTAFGATLAELANALRAAELYEQSAAGYDLWLPEYQLVLNRFPELKNRALAELKDFSAELDAIPAAAVQLESLKPSADSLAKDLEDAYEHYRKVDSSRATEFDLLRRRVVTLDFYTTPFKNTHARLKDSPAAEKARVIAYELPPAVTRRDLVSYPKTTDFRDSVTRAETEMDQLKLLMVEEERLRAVAADCGQAKPLSLLGEFFDPNGTPSPNPPAHEVKPATPPVPVSTTPSANGLQILGLNRMTPGQHDRFTAADGFERPYTGHVEWNSSVEDVVTIDRRTGDAVAFKPGRSVIIARGGDQVAYFNVTVDAIIGNFQGLTLVEAQALASQSGIQVQPGGSAGPPPSLEQAGRVARQDPPAGVRALAGAIVQVAVYDTAVAPHEPDAPTTGPGGFESLGGETRQVPPSQPPAEIPDSSPEGPADMVGDFFRGQPAQPSRASEQPLEDPLMQQRAEEQARAERERRERDNGMMNLLGVMAGASQQMNDLRNRRQGQATPSHTPPPVQSTSPNAGSPPVYNPPGGSPAATQPAMNNGHAPAATRNGCARFPFDWRPTRAWEKKNGRMVEAKGRLSILGNWRDIPCRLSTAWDAIQEYECVRTGERRCQGRTSQ